MKKIKESGYRIVVAMEYSWKDLLPLAHAAAVLGMNQGDSFLDLIW
jgi:hypothetical protein